VVAVAVGFVAVFILSLGTDELLHVLHVYPPWNQTMYEPGLNFLALSYRIIYTIIGAYITAKLAPQNPMRHAVALGVVGTIVSVGLAIATIPMRLGPSWYPIAIVLTGLPCCWLGGVLYSARHAD
jgi:hypothetical protein